MSRIQPREALGIRERIVNATCKGRLQDWNERIGDIAFIANARLGEINWNQAPEFVARELIDYFNRRDEIETLLAAIDTYEAAHKG